MEAQQGNVQFVEPNNHRVNAAERAIQTFKNHFISGLCTTDPKFPFQLWNHLTHQAFITCNILQRSHINPDISAFEQLHGAKFDWNAHPMAPPGTRAVIHSSPLTRTSWGPRGIDAWYCGPSADHYRCNHFHVLETRAMRISGTFELYPVHCQLPTLSPTEHTQQVAHELVRCMKFLPLATRKRLFTTTIQAIRKCTSAPPEPDALDGLPWQPSKGAAHPTNTSSTNPTAPQITRSAPRIHQRNTHNNVPPTKEPMAMPTMPTLHETNPTPPKTYPAPTEEPTVILENAAPRRSPRIALLSPQLYSHAALSAIAIQAYAPHTTTHAIPWTCEHFCALVTHPVTGETITKYNKLIADPITRQVWSRAFGKEFGNLVQGDNVTNTPGTDSIFVMTHEQIRRIPHDRMVTYTQIVVDYRPQKADPNRVCLTVGGNLIDYPGELTTRTADLTTTKMLWNSVISTKDARYLCLDIKNFYLGTPMDRFKYMKMPINIFPAETIKQYNLHKHAKMDLSTLKSGKQSTASPKRESWQTNCSVNGSVHTDTTKCPTCQGYGSMCPTQHNSRSQ
jgi:hypothetical protein